MDYSLLLLLLLLSLLLLLLLLLLQYTQQNYSILIGREQYNRPRSIY